MIEVILHRILVKRDEPVDTDATKTKKEMERLGFQTSEYFQKELEKQAGREAASQDRGIVVAVGPTAFKDYGIDSPIRIGDYIVYSKFDGKDIVDPDDEQTYTVLNDESVIAIITSNKGA